MEPSMPAAEDNDRPIFKDTQYGFQWGPIEVEREIMPEWRKGRGRSLVLKVTTESGQRLDLYISPRGRSLRVYRGHRELT